MRHILYSMFVATILAIIIMGAFSVMQSAAGVLFGIENLLK